MEQVVTETLHLIQHEVTVPKIIVSCIIYGIVHGTFAFARQGKNDIERFHKQIKTQHRKHRHGAEFEDCRQDNCLLYEPTAASRLKHLRQA